MRAAEVMNFAEGTLWSEPGAGTNAIGTAIAADHAVQVFGPEHFNEPVQRWTCSAAPIHDPDTGALLGIIDLTGDFTTVHPHSLAVATATAQAVEATLRLELQEIDARLRARYGDRVAPRRPPRARRAVGPPDHAPARRLGRQGPARRPARRRRADAAERRARRRRAGQQPRSRRSSCTPSTSARRRAARPLLKLALLGRDRARLEIDGRESELRPRLAEILVLLCAQPGRHKRRGAVRRPARRRRQPRQRARRGLAPAQAARPVDRHRALPAHLRRRDRRRGGSRACSPAGDVREAAEEYPGPLLPGSEAPGVVREREQLDGWLRQAVMTADDPEALWAWVQTPDREDDLGAWKRLLSQLAFHDPRRCPLRRARRRAACSADVTDRWCHLTRWRRATIAV